MMALYIEIAFLGKTVRRSLWRLMGFIVLIPHVHAAIAREAIPARLASGPWSGAVSSTTAEVRAKIDWSGRGVRLWVSRNPGLLSANILGPVLSDTNKAGGVVGFTVSGLMPNTTYY